MFCTDSVYRVVKDMAETSSSLIVAYNKLFKFPDHSELIMTPSISILVFPKRNNSSVVETTDEMSTDYILPTEQTSNSPGDLVVGPHGHIPVLPAKSELVVPLITLHYEEQITNNEAT